MYYIEKNGEKITGKGYVSIDVELAENQSEVTEEEYNSIVLEGPPPDTTPQPAPQPIIQELQDQLVAQAEAIAALYEKLNGGE